MPQLVAFSLLVSVLCLGACIVIANEVLAAFGFCLRRLVSVGLLDVLSS